MICFKSRVHNLLAIVVKLLARAGASCWCSTGGDWEVLWNTGWALARAITYPSHNASNDYGALSMCILLD